MKIDYVELSSTDFMATKAFYGTVFGWSFEEWGADYMAFSGAGLDGGFRKCATPAPRGGALVIFYAQDLDGAEGAIKQAGGEILEHHEFPGGKRFHFTDTTGNELAVWTKAD